jgi:Chalcone isomerase-like
MAAASTDFYSGVTLKAIARKSPMRRFVLSASLALTLFAVIVISPVAHAAEAMPARLDQGGLVLATDAWQRDTGMGAVDVGVYAAARLAQRGDFATAAGARRLRLVPARALSADQIGRLLVRDLASAANMADAASHMQALMQLGGAFSTTKALSAGDSLGVEFVPGKGTRAFINDAPVGGFVGDAAFFALIMRPWLAPQATLTAAAR